MLTRDWLSMLILKIYVKKIVLVLVFVEELNPLFLKSVFLNYINP